MANFANVMFMTDEQIRDEIEAEFRKWNKFASGECSDSSWPDGLCMNVIRTKILRLFRLVDPLEPDYDMLLHSAPPELPNAFMVKDGKYVDRFDGKPSMGSLIFGTVEEYVK